MKALETKSLTKQFGGLAVLQEISLHVEKGERRAIIGPNGAGKTTLFNTISGLIKPNAGEIFIFGEKVTQLSSYRRARLGLARTFQQNNLFFNLNLLENINLAISSHKDKFTPRDFLEKWGWWEKRDIPVKELSYGEQRQVELLLALAQTPRLLLLDEPTAGMSSAETNKITTMIGNLSREITVLIIEHDMKVVFDFADQITVLNYGRVLFEGAKGEVRSNERVKEVYLGSAD
ncbi:ATP-binding cassette domain-containing protein [Desulfosporosinus sp. Sb-LF]|uniref:ABC transporter ATP-binding protein n=1 Tax=Desulfosporosinus sp. Sb-LF TaxID=2560027 RepID=UPI00107F6892|nr:ATP-binding cassette domain-containing protein [Desulfosporosinus sp. Sb-LF]TGE32134.1 ATP-binding cassette domain-containing protein [Desulfosporosinus sp. Sb-LF]